MELNISGIKCDTPACDYNDPSVKVEEYKDWVNKPCPKCGGNLLTEADYNGVQALIQMTQLLNQRLPKPDPNEPKANVTLTMDGTGNMTITDIREVKDIKE